MKIQTENFSLLWLPYAYKDADGLNLLLPDSFKGHLPWFIWGDNKDKFEATGSFRLSPDFLLKGILYGMSPDAFKVGISYSEDDYLFILEKLRRHYEYRSMEALISGTAYSIKTTNGILPCLSALKTGVHLLPESSAIKSDYIMGLWEKACEDKDDMGIYEKILELLPEIDLTAINSSAKECVCYYGFCSLFLLKHDTKLKHDTNKYIEQYIDGMITFNEIQLKIDDLLNNPDKEFTPEELRVHDD